MQIHRSAHLAALVAAAVAVGCGTSPDQDTAIPAHDERSATAAAPDESTGDGDFGDPDGDEGSSDPSPGSLELGIDIEDSPDVTPSGSSGSTSPVPPTAKPTPKPAPSGYVATALASPNEFFKRQVRHTKWNPTGPLFSGNCAPTSLAMAAKVFAKEPAGLSIEQSIDRVRVMMNKPSDSGGATSAQVRLGAQRLGLQYRAMSKGELDSELAKKRVVVLTGYPGLDGTSSPSVYQSAFRAAGYDYTFDTNHSIAVFGKTATGKYVVADPLSKVGVITMTAVQMRDYWARWGGSGTSVWR